MALCECTFKSKFMNLSEILRKKDELLYYNFHLETDNQYTNYFSDMSFNTDSNAITSNSYKLEECLFKNKNTKECKESVEFVDLINQDYLPVNSKIL